MSDDLYELGVKTRAEVLGQGELQYKNPEREEFEREFRRMTTEVAWGRIWGDDGLSRQQHSLNCLCILAVLNRPAEFKAHFRGAIRNGCTRAELKATLHQIAGYAGIPAGVEAFRIAAEVFRELKAEGS